MRLKDKVAIITGSSKGAGRATARLFAQEGAHVVINARDGELLRKVHDEISVFGRKVISVPCDVANWEDVKKMARIAMAEFEKIDILVNMVGGSQPPVPLEDLDVELWDKQIKSNLYSAFYCSKAVVKQMKNQRGGKIVNVASVAGRSVSQFGGVLEQAPGREGAFAQLSNPFAEDQDLQTRSADRDPATSLRSLYKEVL